MRFLPKMLMILAFGAGVVWAQTTVVTTTVSSSPTMMVCPSPFAVLPAPCPAMITQTIGGDQTVLVLGSQETLGLNTVSPRHVGWMGVPSNYESLFTEGNPLTYTQVNGAVSRHGNPYYPYFALPPSSVRVAGLQEQFTSMTTLSAMDQATLQTVGMRYRGLTTSEAQVLGYQPMGAFTPGLGQVYLNNALVGNQINPLLPQAFIFDRKGKLVGAQYDILSTQPVMLFGQTTMPSGMITGAQQLTVWLYTNNRSGLFAPMNPGIR